MYTFQDYSKETDKLDFLRRLISNHEAAQPVKMAKQADLYDRQQNTGIAKFYRMVSDAAGRQEIDRGVAQNHIASNFFAQLNNQRCMYSLGNGIFFSANGEKDEIKESLGSKFDTDLRTVAYKALIHGCAFGFWNMNRLYCFPITEFAPLWDEENGTLRAGVRYWRLQPDKPLYAVLYEEDGYTKYVSESKGGIDLKLLDEKRAYKQTVISAPMVDEAVVGSENYSALPIVPMWGSRLKQSTLVGMKGDIDAYDIVMSGFANDLQDCAEMYMLVENYGGMSNNELADFKNKLKYFHIANIDSSEGGRVSPVTNEIPYAARKEMLDQLRSKMYEDFGVLDVHTVEAGATNDHIEAGYQTMDIAADDFEYQIIEFVQQILALQGIDATPLFKRNKISNMAETVDMVIKEAPYLDTATILNKLPNITVDEIPNILDMLDAANENRFAAEEGGEE